MKDYFKRLFEYDRYANQIILETTIKASKPDKVVKLMAHLLAAQQIWLNRCKGLPNVGVVLWPDWQADTFAGIIAENNKEWLNFIDGLQECDFEKLVSYQNLSGESFKNRLCDVLMHVINHGTHHRAQVGQHLIAAGIEKLPTTDYIFFIRSLNY